MAERNWGMVTSGATFESLVTTLIFFEDSQAALFGRRGKDGGQDARSGDGSLVFQAKHHKDASAAKAIADAKSEAAKILKYRTTGHAREPQWRAVSKWRLVTNAAFNPTDRQNWDAEVVPLFQVQGLAADYWEQANINALLDKHPEVDRVYFQNQTRAFLSLPEIKEVLPDHEPFLKREVLGTFVGREPEVLCIQSLLESTHQFLVVHGAGGVGKTRLVLEAGERTAGEGKWQVLWANVASMEASGAWFDAIVPERPTLLIVDEPDNDQVLRVLSEQLAIKVGRASQWKVVITARSTNDPVLKFLFNPRMKPRVDELCVDVLPGMDAESMCRDLIATGSLSEKQADWQDTVVKDLAARYSNHPIWLTLSIHVLESAGDLAKVPEKAAELAEYYLTEVVSQQSEYAKETVLEVLRWVALAGTLNRESDSAITLIASKSQLKSVGAAKAALASLVRRRVLAERGARNRLVELKPDVLREHLLLSWLTDNVGYGKSPLQPSEAGKEIVEAILTATLRRSLDSFGRATLESLAHTELTLRLSGHDVQLLGPLMEGIEDGVHKVGAATRVAIAETLVVTAVYRPEDTIRISGVLRTSPCATEHIKGIFGSREVGREDVLLALAWPVFHAAFGARCPEVREQVLNELCEIAELESQVATEREHGLPSDGKRANVLIRRTLEGAPQFWSDFEDAASTIATRLLDEAANNAPSTSRIEVLKSLLTPAMSVKREHSWSTGDTINFQTHIILPGHPSWATRAKLKSRSRGF